jgi:putative Mg2+ transporter-C (MgtC) family protein
LAVLLGGVIGIEREITHKPAGLRTHMLVCLGSCLFTIISVHEFNVDPAKLAAGIVTGIGFIGAGAIIAERERVVGITTAASLWVTAALATLLVFIILSSRLIFRKLRMRAKNTG